MSYRSDVYKSVMEQLQSKRSRALLTQAQNRSIAFEKVPQLEMLEREISTLGPKLYRIIEKGEDVAQKIEELSKENSRQNEQFEGLLVENGFPRDFLEIKYDCPICDDTGFANGEQCQCLKQLIRQESSDRLNRLSPVKLCDFESFDLKYYDDAINPSIGISNRARMSAIFNFCKDYARYFSRSSKSLLMQGNTGLGKTHLSLAIAKTVIEYGYDVVYGSVFNLLSKVERERFGKDEDEDSYNHLLSCDLLILDDLGTEFSSSYTKAAIHSIINTRQLSQLPTIISTNLTMEELMEHYSDRIVSRLFNGYERLVFLGKDIRFEKRKFG